MASSRSCERRRRKSSKKNKNQNKRQHLSRGGLAALTRTCSLVSRNPARRPRVLLGTRSELQCDTALFHHTPTLTHPPSPPLIYSVKRDTCINSGRILELCVPHTICSPADAPLLSKPAPTPPPPPSAVPHDTTRGQPRSSRRRSPQTPFQRTFNPY